MFRLARFNDWKLRYPDSDQEEEFESEESRKELIDIILHTNREIKRLEKEKMQYEARLKEMRGSHEDCLIEDMIEGMMGMIAEGKL